MAVESLGDAAYLYAESAVAPDGLIARIPPLDTYRTGEALHVHAQAEHCHLFDEHGQALRRLSMREGRVTAVACAGQTRRVRPSSR